MKSQTNIHHTVPVDTLADLYANPVNAPVEQPWPNRSNGPPIEDDAKRIFIVGVMT